MNYGYEVGQVSLFGSSISSQACEVHMLLHLELLALLITAPQWQVWGELPRLPCIHGRPCLGLAVHITHLLVPLRWSETSAREGERKAVSGSSSAAYDHISHPVRFCIMPLGVIIGACIWHGKKREGKKCLSRGFTSSASLFRAVRSFYGLLEAHVLLHHLQTPVLHNAPSVLNAQPVCLQSLNKKRTHTR